MSMFNNPNQMPNNNNNNNNQDNYEENIEPLDFNDIFVDTDDTGEVIFGSNNQNNNVEPNSNYQPTARNNVPPANNQIPDISQHPLVLQLIQQNQQQTAQLQQLASLVQNQGNQFSQLVNNQQNQVDINEIMSDPTKLDNYINQRIQQGVNQGLQQIKPQIQQVQQLTQQQQFQNNFNQAYTACSNRYSDFQQVIGSDQNKALKYIQETGSLDAAYAMMKQEIITQQRPNQRSNNNVTPIPTRRQRVNNVEYGGNQNNNLQRQPRIFDRDPRKNSMAQALADALGE